MAKKLCQSCPQLDIMWWKRGKDSWQQTQTGLDNINFMNTDNANGLLCFDFDVCIIQAKAGQIHECQRCRQYFTQAFAIPELWWAEYCRKSNGYFGCEDTTNEQGNITSFNTWTRFLIKHLTDDKIHYKWYKLNVFTRWLSSSGQTILLIFDAPSPIAERLPNPLLGGLDTEQFGDPFWIYPRLVEEVVRLQDQAVWAIRDQIRATEKERAPTRRPKPDFRSLHDIARHAIHVSETLDLAIKTIDRILVQHNDFMTEMADIDKSSKWVSKNTHKRLLFYEHMFNSLRSRAASNKERLLNEIGLMFNTVAQYDSAISVEIGRAAQIDSAAMKTIAFLTLIFLPPTFISAIFSMSFFNYGPDSSSWTVSDKFWVYWAVTIPTTIVTSLLWYYWHKLFPPMLIGEDKVDEDDTETKASLAKITKGLQGNIRDVESL